MTASWSRPHVGSTEYKRGSRDCSRPMAGSPRIIARPTTRSRAACRRARVRQGQAFGGAEEAPSLTATARDGGGNVRSGWKNARGAGRTKEWSNNARQKWRDAPLTKKAPYKPDALIGHVRFDERGWETERCRMAPATAPILDSTQVCVSACPRYRRSQRGCTCHIAHHFFSALSIE